MHTTSLHCVDFDYRSQKRGIGTRERSRPDIAHRHIQRQCVVKDNKPVGISFFRL